jgi:hypothetical protein
VKPDFDDPCMFSDIEEINRVCKLDTANAKIP